MPVHLQTEALVDFDARVLKLKLLLQRPVSRFLEQPGAEALAYFQKMFNAFAESPLLGLSALAGIVGLFAYAKALLELERSKLYIGSLISASDVTAFAIRLGVPFVLLALAVGAVVFGLVMILALSQRDERGAYWGFTITAVIFCGLFLLTYGAWVQAGRIERWTLFLAWSFASAILIGVALNLYEYGKDPGVEDEDMLQRRLLSVLHFITLPGPLLSAIVVIGLYLTVPPHSSILFDPLFPWSITPRASSRAKGLMVVVAKSIAQPIVAGRITEIDSLVAVQEVGPRVVSGTAQSQDVQGAPERWLVLQSADVRCVGPLNAQSECGLTDSSKAAPSSNPHQELTSHRSPGLRQDEQPLSGLAPPPASIALYAETFLDCDAASFRDSYGTALVFNFSKGQHVIMEREQRGRKMDSFTVVPVSNLSEPDLEGVRGLKGVKRDLLAFLREGTAHPQERLWVLGFASVSGRPSSNADLSQNRARTVLRYLEGVNPKFYLDGRYRGLGANLFSGLGSSQEGSNDRIAVALFCRNSAGYLH